MLNFYKKAITVLVGLLTVSVLLLFGALKHTFISQSLLPRGDSELPWRASPEDDTSQGGASEAIVLDDTYGLEYDLFIAPKAQYPAASVGLVFTDAKGEPRLVDLSRYSELTFTVKCSPANELALMVFTVDERVTKLDDFLTYRSPLSFFSCGEQWQQQRIDLTRLETPQWWLTNFDFKLSMSEYSLQQVPKILFASTTQSPQNQLLHVRFNQLELAGKEWGYVYCVAVFLFVLWTIAGVWLFRQHTRALTESLKRKIQQDRPLVAYQQLSVEPKRDKDSDAILRYLTTEYANPELNLEALVNAIGVSRTKINDILKAELGFTFTGYLNKLRLTEAARLLSESKDVSVGEIAYSVGYKNISYFNKLFKEEYGCSPKVFRSVY
ncbi:helix-turn-helix domain-containing protein [Gilvimarinus japonicus]|uniref:Helix-turn-helix domain-containing protein n=1 Tax=Gilvimarinus japonicus TaxID=1796469 RepID=A0ABV7HJC4_9GAMM